MADVERWEEEERSQLLQDSSGISVRYCMYVQITCMCSSYEFI